jgi:hypothetical protein
LVERSKTSSEKATRQTQKSNASNQSSNGKSSQDYGREVTCSLLSSGCNTHVAPVCGSLAASGVPSTSISAIAQSLADESDYSD